MRSFLLIPLLLAVTGFKQNAVHNDGITYCLPFSKNNTFLVSQADNGKTHKDNHRYAYDFVMPVGSPVHAARNGVIVDLKDNQSDRAQTEEFKAQGNYILLEHEDGTYALYAHLDKKGASVKVGQKIRTGQLIGYSGNTGYTSGPHLHFEVFSFKGRKTFSVPVKFNVGEITPVYLGPKKSYKAPGSCYNF